MVAVCVSALALTAAGPTPESGVVGPDAVAAAEAAAMQSQKCVLCGRAFADKLAQLCSSCDRGKCFKCGGAFPDKVARVCSGCFKNKCINCGRAFPDKAAKLCNRCAN
jgi:predicted  nucleic acid-binding Zn-ribbon protein